MDSVNLFSNPYDPKTQEGQIHPVLSRAQFHTLGEVRGIGLHPSSKVEPIMPAWGKNMDPQWGKNGRLMNYQSGGRQNLN